MIQKDGWTSRVYGSCVKKTIDLFRFIDRCSQILVLRERRNLYSVKNNNKIIILNRDLIIRERRMKDEAGEKIIIQYCWFGFFDRGCYQWNRSPSDVHGWNQFDFSAESVPVSKRVRFVWCGDGSTNDWKSIKHESYLDDYRLSWFKCGDDIENGFLLFRISYSKKLEKRTREHARSHPQNSLLYFCGPNRCVGFRDPHAYCGWKFFAGWRIDRTRLDPGWFVLVVYPANQNKREVNER